jgi:hypothetical protein
LRAVRDEEFGHTYPDTSYSKGKFEPRHGYRKRSRLSSTRFHTDRQFDYYECFIRKDNWPFIKPMPFRPPKLTPRIRAQRGFFTVHERYRRPLDCIFRGHVRQIRLHADAIDDARRFLELGAWIAFQCSQILRDLRDAFMRGICLSLVGI